MVGACAGIRVLDLSTSRAGSLAGMILADYGADVIRVAQEQDKAGSDEPAYLFLNRGKKSIDLDLRSAQGRHTIHRLIPSIDVVIETMRPGDAAEAGLGYDVLSRLNPALVYLSITAFGPKGPLARVKADDGLVMAKAGIYRDQPGWTTEKRPVFRSCRDATLFAGMLGVQGILGALRVRDYTGKGQLVETSLLQALACRQNPKVRYLLRDGEALPSEAGGNIGAEVQSEKHVLPHHLDPRQINLIGMRVEVKDGRWLMHSHTEPHFFPAWIETIGLKWIWEDERFKGAPYKFPNTETKLALIEIIQKRMKERTAEEWMKAYVANGNVCGDAVQTTQESLKHPQTVESGLLIEIEDPRVGKIVEIGPLAKIPGAPAEVRGSAPIPGQHTDEILSADLKPLSKPTGGKGNPKRPLDGITIVEAAYYYATPFSTALLGELGARVIKIEPLKSDPYRIIANAGVGDPVNNMGHNNMVRAMQGKESIALNLKDPRGKEILHGLVKKADIFIHNFRKGVPETLGMDEATLRKINPKLVYQYGASYGSIGPYSRQPAIDPIIAAYAGTTAYQAGEGNPPLTETGADPTAAAGCAASTMLALFARHRTDQGQYVESAMIVSNIYLNYEDALSYKGKRLRRPVDHDQLGTGATYRLYETARVKDSSKIPDYANPDPHWVFFSAETDEEFGRFCNAVSRADIAQDPRFAKRAGREENDKALAGLLEPIFKSKTAQDWETSLLAADVGCVMADAMSHFAFLYRDPQALATDMVSAAEHPAFGGKYWRYAPMLRFSETPGRGGPFCEFAEHTRALLKELGYSEAAMLELKEAGVTTWPASQTEAAKVHS